MDCPPKNAQRQELALRTLIFDLGTAVLPTAISHAILPRALALLVSLTAYTPAIQNTLNQDTIINNLALRFTTQLLKSNDLHNGCYYTISN